MFEEKIFVFLLIFVIGVLVGILIGVFLFRNKNKDLYFENMFSDLKNSINEYYKQSLTTSIDIKHALKSANELAKTLTTNQNIKGKFGENCLENVLNYCFPNKNLDYIKQINSVNEDGEKIKPDFLVCLPKNKSIVIDCKLNLQKYIEFCESDEQNKELRKSEFIKDINSTINSLSNKKYQTAVDIKQPDFILMYIPLENVLNLIYTDKEFFNIVKNANDKNIIIVGNSSILTTIRLVNLLWAQEKQEKNIENIISIANNIYNILALHSQSLYNLKNQLNNSNELFNKEYEKFVSNNKLFKEAEKLKDYGIEIKTKKTGSKISEIEINKEFLNN